VPKRGYRFIASVEEKGAEPEMMERTEPEVVNAATATARIAPPPRFARRLARPASFAALAAGVALWWSLSRPSPEIAPPKIVPFTVMRGNEMHPAFAPDGNQLAFVWDGEQEDNPDIYVKQLGNESLLRPTTDPAADTRPCWSPDGRFIAFTRELTTGSALYLLPSLGGTERKITQLPSRGTSGNQMSWSPDSEWLAVSDRGGIFLVARETGEKRQLTASPPLASAGDRSPAISPDGKRLAFFRDSELYLVPTAGGEPQLLVASNTQSWSPAWTPDGREILFLSARSGGSKLSLWRVSADGGAPKQVEAAGQNLDSFALSRQGQSLAWTQTSGDQNIWRMEWTGVAEPRQAPQSARLLISSTRVESGLQISPDGKKIAFGSDRSGSFEIWVAESTGEHPIQLTSFNRSITGSPHWSPDGRQIVFDSRAEGRGDIYVISAEGGPPRRLTTDPAEDVAPSWSRDGASIYFCSTRSGSHRLWKMPATGGEAVMITKQGLGGHECVESPDGRFLYYQKLRLVPGIWRVPVAGGDETLVLDHHRAGYWRHWTVVEQGIYFATAERPEQPLIEFFSFATGRVTHVATLQKGIDPWTSGLAVSPDGRWLVWSQVDQVGNDIMLMENFR
jgi:Tol biopolymer transport system component